MKHWTFAIMQYLTLETLVARGLIKGTSCMSDQSVTYFIQQLQKGDRDAAMPIWNHFYSRLVSLAGKKLKGRVKRVVEGEDVAQAVFNSCFQGLAEGRFPDIRKRENLWALLIRIAEFKASNVNRKFHTGKAGRGNVRGDSFFISQSDSFAPGLDGIAGDEPTPEFAAIVAEQAETLLKSLSNEDTRTVAKMLLEGYRQLQIAKKTGFTITKIERKVKLIRETWSRVFDEQAS